MMSEISLLPIIMGVGAVVATYEAVKSMMSTASKGAKSHTKAADIRERSLGQRWQDFKEHKDMWEKVKEVTEPGKQKGTTSYERAYQNKKTGEKIYTHEIKNDKTSKTTHGEHPRDYSKGKDDEESNESKGDED